MRRAAVVIIGVLFLISCGGKTQHIVRKAHDDVKALTLRGNELFYAGRYDDAAKAYDRARLLATSIDDRQLVAENLNNLGQVYLVAKSYGDAREKFEEALRLNEQENDVAGEVANHINIGNLTLEEGKPEIALEEFERAEKKSAGKDTLTEATLLNNRGKALRMLRREDEARRAIDRALNIALSQKRHRLAAACWKNLGALHEGWGETAKAREAYAAALEEDRLVEYSVGIADDLHHLGRMDEALDQHDAAFANYERAYVVNAELRHKEGMIKNLAGLLALPLNDTSRHRLARYREIFTKLQSESE